MKYLLLGQKNVGKSSIFNRIIGNRSNIVNRIEGTTRDWIEYPITLNKKLIYLTDTPGINPLSNSLYDKEILTYIKNKVSNEYVILFVVNVKNQISEIDKEILRTIRKFNIKIILVINKVDNKKLYLKSDIFSVYGIEKIFNTSCSHNIGLKDLNEYLFNNTIFSIDDINISSNNELTIGVYGKPNAGKSTFINTLLGYKRFQTGDMPGLTTDSTYHIFNYKNLNIKIYDTAGIKAKRKNRNTLDIFASNISLNNIKNTTICILIIDCLTGLDTQDKKIINLISKLGKFIIIVFNKFDLINQKTIFKKDLKAQLNDEIHQVKNIKYYFISSFNIKDVKKIFDFVCFDIVLDKKISTSQINLWLKKTTKEHAHPMINGKRVTFKYAIQTKTSPINLKIFSNQSKHILKSYERYLINNFTKFFNIKNQVIKIYFDNSKNPYSKLK